MSSGILQQCLNLHNNQYDFIPYSDWNNDGNTRPAPYKLNQLYSWSDSRWSNSDPDRVGIRLNRLVLVDYDGNKEDAQGEIPSVQELASTLGFASAADLYDSSLIQWNQEQTSLHFFFQLPESVTVDEIRQNNGLKSDRPFFWKHIDLKTGNQLTYLKTGKEFRLPDINGLPVAPQSILDQLVKPEREVVQSDTFIPDVPVSDHQRERAEEWLTETCIEMAAMSEGDRNIHLNNIACTTSGLVAGGALDNQFAFSSLFNSACEAGLGRHEVQATLESAWFEGFRTPRREPPWSGKVAQTASEMFSGLEISNTNIDAEAEKQLTELFQELPEDDPDMGMIFAQAKAFKDEWVMTGAAKYTNVETLAEYQKTAFDQMFASQMPIKPGRGFKRFKPSEIAEKAGMRVVSELAYRPDKDRLFYDNNVLFLNSYRPFNPARPDDTEVNRVRTLIYNHVDWLIEDKSYQRLVLDWMAWQVQNTGRLIRWAPLVMGAFGDGKSALGNLVAAAVGGHNSKQATTESLCRDFQPWAHGALLTTIEELSVPGRIGDKVYNMMKIYIENNKIPVNDKQTKEVTVKNTVSYMAFSNFSNPIPIPPSDRRWLVLQTRHFGLNSVTNRTQTDMRRHFDDLMNIINNEEHHPAIHWALKDHIISDDFSNTIGRAPVTEFANQLVTETASENELLLQAYLENARLTDGSLLLECEHGFRITDFYPFIPNNYFSGFDKKPSDKIIGRWLRKLGYERKHRRVAAEYSDQTLAGTVISTFKQPE